MISFFSSAKILRLKKDTGLGLIEIIIGSAIVTVGVLALISSFTTYLRYALNNSGNVQAAFLAEEGLEVMTYFRDKGWINISGLSTTTNYYLTFGTDWATTTTPQGNYNSTFVRKITVSDLQRNGAGALVSSGGTYDVNTKQITVAVEYKQSQGTTTKMMTSYLANINE